MGFRSHSTEHLSPCAQCGSYDCDAAVVRFDESCHKGLHHQKNALSGEPEVSCNHQNSMSMQKLCADVQRKLWPWAFLVLSSVINYRFDRIARVTWGCLKNYYSPFCSQWETKFACGSVTKIIRKRCQPRRNVTTLIEKDHLGDWSPEKDWWLMFRQLAQKPSWLWRWLPLRLSKRQSLTTVLLRTPIPQMISFNQGSHTVSLIE